MTRGLLSVALAAAFLPAAAAVTPVTVRMSESSCRASPAKVRRGVVSFALLNRGRRARLFAIAGKRSAYVRPHRRGRLTATLRTPGRFPFVCAARGKPRSVRRGILVVTGPPPPPAPPPPAPPPPPPPPPAPPPAPPTHRVAVSGNHFVEAGTSAPFVARGATYSRFGTSAVPHVTFNVGAYDAARAEDALAEMHVGGYNVVRVFLEIGCADVCLGDPGTHGLRVAYLANLADFLRRAKANAITVMIEGSSVPNGTKYAGMVGTSPDIENINRLYLTAGGVAAEAAFWRDLVAELERQGAPTDDVFAYDIGVETFYDGRYKPFTLSSGAVATGNGKSYDMAVPAQRDLMMDDNLVNFADQVRAAIRSVDPTALVTMSFFAPMGPNLYRVGDFRLVRTKPVFDRSALDFLAVHPYPGVALDLPAYMQNFGLDGSEPKPVVMGEFGAFKWSYKTTGEATPALQQWQADSCRYGFDGWLFWTWDSPSPQPDGGELWNSLDGGAALEHALAPTFRPDPCAPTTNLALGRPVTASSQVVPDNPASMAVDGGTGSFWSSGGSAPQSLEIDLGSPRTIGRVLLVARLASAGGLAATERLYGKARAEEGYVQLDEFTAPIDNGTEFERMPATPWTDVRYLKVETVVQTGDVAWREIQVFDH